MTTTTAEVDILGKGIADTPKPYGIGRETWRGCRIAVARSVAFHLGLDVDELESSVREWMARYGDA